MQSPSGTGGRILRVCTVQGLQQGELATFVSASSAQVAAGMHRELKGKRVLRQRLIALVDLSEAVFYALIVERVHGSEEHTFSFHGPDDDATPANLTLEPYNGTTLGEGLEYGDFSSTNAIDPELSCPAFLWEPAKGTPKGVWSLGEALRRQEDIHLHITSVYPKVNELIVVKGKSPGSVSKCDMTWVIQHGHSESPSTTQYPMCWNHVNNSTIEKIERLPVSGGKPNAQYHSRGHRHDPAPTQGSTDCDRGRDHIRRRVRVVVKEQQQAHSSNACPRHKATKDNTGVTRPEAESHGQIASCDWKGTAVTIRLVSAPVAEQSVRHIRITNCDGNSVSYQIVDAEQVKNGCRIRLGLDPRIGEGFVKGYRGGVVTSKTYLKLYPFGYYAGKTLANETNDVFYRLSNVARHDCFIAKDQDKDQAATPEAAFYDRNRDGLC